MAPQGLVLPTLSTWALVEPPACGFLGGIIDYCWEQYPLTSRLLYGTLRLLLIVDSGYTGSKQWRRDPSAVVFVRPNRVRRKGGPIQRLSGSMSYLILPWILKIHLMGYSIISAFDRPC